MRMGTKSLLWGCHQFLLHPIFTLWGWVRLYGWRSVDLVVILVAIIHDWGYWGCSSMDGDDGFVHPLRTPLQPRWDKTWFDPLGEEIWYHSRHLCAELRAEPSRLCWADKLGTALMPSWLWAIMAAASGEGWEYMSNPHGQDYVAPEEMTIPGLRRFHLKYKQVWGDPTRILVRARLTRMRLNGASKSDKLDEWLRYK